MALGVIVVFMIVEAVGGWISGSLALLADAAHMLTDALALALAASAQIFSMRPADETNHFGYRRAQVLAAFVNGILMAVLLVWIVFEAVRRFLDPEPINSTLMLWVAIVGFCANIAAFFILHQKDERDLNVRGAMLHVVGDLLGSGAAIIAALIIGLTGWLRIDPVLSVIVAFLIGVSAFRLLRETGLILLQGAPAHIDIAALSEGLKAHAPSIKDVHDVRIWQLTPEHPRLTLHACVDRAEDSAEAIKAAKDYLATHFKITHSTIQIDVGGECPDGEINLAQATLEIDRATSNNATPQQAGVHSAVAT